MTSRVLALIVAACALPALAGCASSGPPTSGFLKDYSRLQPRDDDPNRLSYVKEGLDLAGYRAIIVDPVQVRPFSVEVQREATPEKLAWLAADLRDVIARHIGEHYPIASQTGTDVLRLRMALTDVVPNAPGSDVEPSGGPPTSAASRAGARRTRRSRTGAAGWSPSWTSTTRAATWARRHPRATRRRPSDAPQRRHSRTSTSVTSPTRTSAVRRTVRSSDVNSSA
jgi:hypothetical protein